MADLSFDDLIPAGKSAGLSFDDLVAPADERPWYSKLGSAADDMARIAANGMTFGYADKFAGAMSGKGTEAERADTSAARDRAGVAAYAGDIGGALATGSGLANAGLTLTKAAPAGVTGLKGLALRSGLMGAEGAGYGALSATGNDTDVGQGALVGALAGVGGNAVGQAVSGAVGKVAGAFNKQPKIPTAEALRASKDAAYQAADNAGVVYTPQIVGRIRQAAQSDLADLGYLPANQPKVGAVLNELDRIAESNVTLKGLDQARRVASGAFDPSNPSSNKMLAKVVQRIDEAIADAQPGDVLLGDGAAGASLIGQARKLNSQVSKGERIAEALQKAERRAASTGSGGNVDNAIRQNIRGILDSPSKRRGFSPDEIVAMEDVVRGTPSQNAARLIGKLSPQGNGLMAALSIGATAANPLLAAAPAAGMMAKTLADRATPNNVEAVQRIIRAGGKRSDAFAPPNAVQRLAESKRDALVRALMMGGLVPATE